MRNMFWIFTRLQRLVAGAALVALLLYDLYAEQTGVISVPQKLLFATGVFLLWTAALYSGRKADQPFDRRRFRLYLRGLLFYYLFVLVNVLFFDAGFGRHAARTGINLKPLLTIRNYLRAYANGNIPVRLMLINLAGNVAAFAPMGVFLPALHRAMRNLFLYTGFVAIAVCAVEGIQWLTDTGSCDIDDLILNLAGALLVWLVVQIPAIKRRLYRALPPKGRKQL